MSLLRLFPTLRTPPVRRVYTAAVSLSAPRRSQAPHTSDFFDDLLKDDSSSHTPIAGSYEAVTTPPVEDDLPPTPPPGSFPRNPPSPNPVTIAREGRTFVRPVYAVSVKSSRNNTIITFARQDGKQLVTLTGGKLGFKKSNRNGYEAGYQCAVGIIARMEEELQRTDFDWHLYLNGFGQGRDAMITALTTTVGTIVKGRLKRITDRTPLKIGGTRGMKARRV